MGQRLLKLENYRNRRLNNLLKTLERDGFLISRTFKEKSSVYYVLKKMESRFDITLPLDYTWVFTEWGILKSGPIHIYGPQDIFQKNREFQRRSWVPFPVLTVGEVGEKVFFFKNGSDHKKKEGNSLFLLDKTTQRVDLASDSYTNFLEILLLSFSSFYS